MILLGRCTVCNNRVDWDLVKEEFADILSQVDAHGVESLTEHQQIAYNGMCCSAECYEKLK